MPWAAAATFSKNSLFFRIYQDKGTSLSMIIKTISIRSSSGSASVVDNGGVVVVAIMVVVVVAVVVVVQGIVLTME